MMQYVPRNGLYVYFRYDPKQTIMCAMNTDSTAASLNPENYSERTSGFHQATDILSGSQFSLNTPISIPGGQMRIMELRK